MKITIIGTGLIGGSFALALQKQFPDVQIIGWDSVFSNLIKAQQLGIIHEIAHDLPAACMQSDYIILAIPVHAIDALLPGILDHLASDQTVVDFGSTKEKIRTTVANHPNRIQYIAAHPIAGTEYSGPEAANVNLFVGKNMIICDSEKTTQDRIADFQRLCEQMKMKVNFMTAQQHDIHLAYISHLSHVIAFSLSNTVLEKEKSDNQLLNLAGSGFESTVRLAKSNPDMWVPIFMQNQKAILEGIESYKQQLRLFKKLLSTGDEEKLRDFLVQANKIRKILEK